MQSCGPERSKATGARQKIDQLLSLLLGLALLGGCASTPMVPYSLETPAMVLVPAAYAGVKDKRARFREIFCTVLETRKDKLPDYRPCEEALSLVDDEPAAANLPVILGPSHRKLIAAFVPGFGFDCFENWLEPPNTVAAHLHDYGYGSLLIGIEGLSGTQRNARLIRDALMALPVDSGAARIVLIGYSKGANDILDAIVNYPELHARLAAVVSIAGAIGGSPLANGIAQELAERLRYFPGAECKQSDHGAIASLRPATRKNWLVRQRLPKSLPYYSLVTLPEEKRISWLLKGSYRKLARVDARNDSQVIFYDQVIPGSTLVGYLNADHWAVAMPIARRHAIIATLFVTQNEFPREVLAEALLRFIEEDLDERQLQTAN